MKRYDISQEVFSCAVYPGDPVPQKEVLLSMNDGAVCNLTGVSMCAHNGTHIDAPYHFLNNGNTVDELGLEPFVGMAYVIGHQGIVSGADAERILEKAGEGVLSDCRNQQLNEKNEPKRILIKGNAEVSLEAAEVFARAKLFLLGNESQTVGPEDAPMAVHKVLLGAGTVLLEGIRLTDVPEGAYLLSAAPLNLAGGDGAPCRAVLLEL